RSERHEGGDPELAPAVELADFTANPHRLPPGDAGETAAVLGPERRGGDPLGLVGQREHREFAAPRVTPLEVDDQHGQIHLGAEREGGARGGDEWVHGGLAAVLGGLAAVASYYHDA